MITAILLTFLVLAVAVWLRYRSHSADPLVRATALVVVMLVGLSAITLWLTAQGRLGDQRAARSDELRACSASFSAELVTGPTAAALKALADHGADSPAFRRAVADADPPRFIRLSRLARTNPDAFLRACHRASG
jgi:hypothetical protein